jgi:hypothetical protein
MLATRSIDSIHRAEISALVRNHRVEGRHARVTLNRLWQEAVGAFVRDSEITDEEQRYLTALRHLLGLSEDEVIAVEKELIYPIFSNEAKVALADREFSRDEKAKLDRLSRGLRLSPAMREHLLRQEAKPALERAYADAIADRRLSPDEQEALSALAFSLDVQVAIDQTGQETLNRFALLWRLENTPLPTVAVPINLQRGEFAHASVSADWSELRKRTVRTGYSGFSTSIRIAKGLSYRVGNYTPSQITVDELTKLDTGTLYVTNKRLIFDGQSKNIALRYGPIIGLEVFSDGIGIEKASGRTPYLTLSGDAEAIAIIISRAMAAA